MTTVNRTCAFGMVQLLNLLTKMKSQLQRQCLASFPSKVWLSCPAEQRGKLASLGGVKRSDHNTGTLVSMPGAHATIEVVDQEFFPCSGQTCFQVYSRAPLKWIYCWGQR